MENKKERRSPRRGYIMSPNSLRPRRSRTRSRSTGLHHRFSPPVHGRRASRYSPPKRRKSRSPNGAYHKFRRSKENDVYTHCRRSRSNDRKPRKYDDEIRKPTYRGPENDLSLKRAVTSPSRIIVVRRIENSNFNDKSVNQKQSGIGSNHTLSDGNEGGNDLSKDDSRFVYIRTLGKGENGPSNQSNYRDRRNPYESSTLSNDRSSSPPRNNYEHHKKGDYELNTHSKDYESNRRFRSDDYDRSEHSKKVEKNKYRSYHPDKPYPDNERRSRISHTRESSKDHRHYDKYDKYDKYEGKRRRSKEVRRNDDSDQHHTNRSEENDHKNETLHDDSQISYEKDQNEQTCSTNEGTPHLNGGLIVPGTVRPVHFDNIIRGIPRPALVPMAPIPIGFVRPVGPPMRHFPFLPRPPPYPMHFIRRPFPHPHLPPSTTDI